MIKEENGISNNMEKNKVYSFEIVDWVEEITGVLLSEGKEWILIHDNSNDFILDGYRFIQKNNIENIIRDKDEVFKENIFKLKGHESLDFALNYNLDNTILLLNDLMNNNNLFQFDFDDEDAVYIGSILEINDTNFKIKSLTSKAEWSSHFLNTFDEITSISINNDYLNSLSLFINSSNGNVHRLKLT